MQASAVFTTEIELRRSDPRPSAGFGLTPETCLRAGRAALLAHPPTLKKMAASLAGPTRADALGPCGSPPSRFY